MDSYLQLLIDHRLLLGEYDAAKVCGLPPQWFWDRRIGLLDFRGDLQIRDNQSLVFGFGVRVLTASHDFTKGVLGEMIFKTVWIERGVFVGSYALLYNCHLQEHSVVACGAVVRNMTVPPFTMVEGNPARPVKKFIYGEWRRL